MNDLILLLDTGQDLILDFGAFGQELTLDLGMDVAYVPPYTGEYEVIPRLTEQVLETNRKRMTDNVTVHEIPITYTPNPLNGRTVVIG